MPTFARRAAELSLLALALAALGAPAHAARPVLPADTCSFSDVQAGGMVASDCRGQIQGNDRGQATLGAAGTLDLITGVWGAGFLPAVELAGSFDATSGQLLLPGVQSTPFVVSLKGGDAFALYRFEHSNGVDRLDFSTAGLLNAGGKHPGLSHASMWVTPVPEPGTVALWLAGLAAVGFVARRRLV